MTAQACIRCGHDGLLFNFATPEGVPNYARCKSDTCGHRFDIPPHLEPSAVIIPAGQDCQHLNTCHYSLAHGCIQPQLRDRDFRCAIARVYEGAV